MRSANASWPETAISRSSAIHRREVFFWIVGALLANQALHLVNTGSGALLLQSLASLNIIVWLATIVILKRLMQSDSQAAASSADVALAIVVGLALCVSSLVGYRVGVGVLVTLVALYMVTASHTDLNLKAAGSVLLALAAYLVWGPLFFQYCTPELLRGDAAIVGTMLAIVRPDIVWSGNAFIGPDGHSIALVGACSSFKNVSIAILGSVAITMGLRTSWVRSDMSWIGAVCVAMVLSNAVRLCVLGWSASAHHYWHDGDGGPIIALAQTVLILALGYFGASRSGRTT